MKPQPQTNKQNSIPEIITIEKPLNFAIELQDRNRKDNTTIYTEHPITEDLYNYYWNQFITLWGKKINFTDARGKAVEGFLKSLIAK